ncbi:HIT domain-containing protein [Tahibacter amnicola]|uniref:HIT family protein n=1 Tax=Tahibacter amnicola TaxID=2976241 RepID=A0ABY6BHS9_9GAMM|nr:HIT family protein [Tahibacter amnicola]MCU7372920.1 HIT family protein [Paucibacter sp. O1-1]MDA3827916.1 HIT family protein [Paucibacter sp. O1-1]UXI69558.1 HIT family protein [Tahibacter amnicola]
MTPSLDTAFVLDPRLANDSHVVGELALSRVLLMNDMRFPWLILVPRRPGLRELTELSREEQRQLLDEVNQAAHVLHAIAKPDKMNIAALGNVVPQLHLHVIARYVGDAAWPRPVWGVGVADPYTAAESSRVLGLLRAGLSLSPET